MKKPNRDAVESYLRMPWTVETGTLDDGTRFARCLEIPNTVAYAEPEDDIGELFWDAMKASIDALVAIGQPVPLPRRVHISRIAPQRTIEVSIADDASKRIIESDRDSWSAEQEPQNGDLQVA